MKKVLVVAHAYPPSNVVGAVRPSKFVHYLPGFGWEPIVLAGRDVHQDIPGNSTAEIYHVREWPHPLNLLSLSGAAREEKRPDRRIRSPNEPSKKAQHADMVILARPSVAYGLQSVCLCESWCPGWSNRND